MFSNASIRATPSSRAQASASKARGGASPAHSTPARIRRFRVLCAASLLALSVGLQATAAPLRVANVSSPAVLCLFDPACRVTVDRDTTAPITLPGTSGEGFLQTRTLPAGLAGMPGEGLIPYLYRVDIRNIVGLTAAPCITRMKIDFGPVASLDYDGDGVADQVFVITGGGLGSVGVLHAESFGSTVELELDQGLCAASKPGGGVTSFFIGLCSRRPPREVVAQLEGTLGAGLNVQARAPQAGSAVNAVPFRRGDVNANGKTDLADAIFGLSFLYTGGAKPVCLKAADINADGRMDLADSVALLSNLFLGSAAIPSPAASCGFELTPSDLPCGDFPVCVPEPSCPDPAASAIDFSIVSRETLFRGVVRITGVVKNVGASYESLPGRQTILLYEKPLGGASRMVARRDFNNLPAGDVLQVSFDRAWDSSSSGEGEFPPSYGVQIVYDPDIYIDGIDTNDDCDGSNNSLERSGSAINDMLR